MTFVCIYRQIALRWKYNKKKFLIIQAIHNVVKIIIYLFMYYFMVLFIFLILGFSNVKIHT